MGAVHGVYLKYVALGSIASGIIWRLEDKYTPLGATLCYFAACNLAVATLFRMRRGMWLLGKNPRDGSVPPWSYVVWWGFHVPTWCYTALTSRLDKRRGNPVATEVADGWYIGGCYSNELGMHWAGVVDLTCEFPEGTIGAADAYKLVAVWDGVPPSPAQLDDAANFCVEARKKGPVLIHCAHGKGRSTCTMVVALTKAGLFDSWEEAFVACKKRRPVIKLNTMMQTALEAWQVQYQKRE